MPIIVQAGTSTSFTLTGRLLMNDMVTPRIGQTVRVRPYTFAMPDPAANNVYIDDIILETDGNGEFSTPLVGLDDVYYTVLLGDTDPTHLCGPFAAPLDGATIDVADIIALVPSPILPLDATALRAEFAAADNLKADKVRLPRNLKDFGADATGGSDASAEVQSWLNAGITNGAVYAPTGRYRLDDPMTAASLEEAKLDIGGDGEGRTVFVVPASNTAGAFILDGTGTPRDAKIRLHDFSIEVQGVGNGTGISYNMSAGGNQHQRSIVLENVEIYGQDPTQDCFDVAIDLSNTYRPYLRNVTVSGPFGTGISDDLTDGSPLFVSTAAIVLDNAYAWQIDDSNLWGAAICIRDLGTDGEGGRLNNTQLVTCLTAFKRSRTAPEPGLKIDGCHWNARNTGLDIDGGKVVEITRCHGYNQDATNLYSGTARDIYLRNTERVQILGNEFQFPGAADRLNIHVDGATLGRDSVIDGNIFGSGGTNAILLSTLTSGITVGAGNIFPGTYTKNIVDNSGMNAIFYADGDVWRMENQGGGSGVGPDFQLVRDSLTPATNDFLGGVTFKGKDSTDALTSYGAIRSHITSPTDTSEGGAVSIWAMIAGTLTKVGQYDTPTTGQTAWHVLVNRSGVFTLEVATLGATDSGGSGFKVLRVPN